MDPSQANTQQTLQRSLLIGQILATGTAVPEEPVEVQSVSQIQALCGRGSILCQMATAYLAGDNFGDLWLLPYVDNVAGQEATGTITFGGACTAPGTLNLYIGGINVQVGVNLNDNAATVAENLVAALTAYPDVAVSAEAATDTVDTHGAEQRLARQRYRYPGQLPRPGRRRIHAGGDHRRHHADGGRHR